MRAIAERATTEIRSEEKEDTPRRAWSNHSAPAAAVFFVAIAVAAIVSTYPVLTQTSDEPAHIACGMQFLTWGAYQYEPQHPPLARIMAALPLYLDGVRTDVQLKMWPQGNYLLAFGGRYMHNLTLARLGVLPFFLIACWAVFAWARSIYSDAAALAAVVLFASTPLALAHAGLATTDMAATAGLTAALLRTMAWVEAPRRRNSVWLGVALGLATLTKFSVAPFFGIAVIAWLAVLKIHPRSERWAAQALLVVAVMVVVIWAGYGFALRPYYQPGEQLSRFIPPWLGTLPLPLTDMVHGVVQLGRHFALGHPSYLLGRRSMHGFALYFPVALAVKLPLTLLLLTGIAAVGLVPRGRVNHDWRLWAAPLAAVAILLPSLASTIDIGLRHLLPALPLLAITAAYTMETALARASRVAAGAIVLLIALQVAGTARQHPDYLAYFNALAGPRPERVLVDSDLDWGQDLGRLMSYCRRAGIEELTLAYFGSADVNRYGVRVRPLRPLQPAAGWVAISKTARALSETAPGVLGNGREYAWLEAYRPVTTIGRSIDLYFVPAAP